MTVSEVRLAKMDCTSSLEFDALGFACDYVIEVDPDFPGDGIWTDTTAGYDSVGTRTDFLDSRGRSTMVMRVEPHGYAPWVISLSAEGGSTFSGIFATPSPDRLLVVNRGTTFLVPAQGPPPTIACLARTTTQVLSVNAFATCLLAGFYSAAALGPDGLRWTSPRLCWDDLVIEGVRGSEVVCSGELPPRSEFSLDLSTGRQVRGPTFADPSSFTASSEFTDGSSSSG